MTPEVFARSIAPTIVGRATVRMANVAETKDGAMKQVIFVFVFVAVFIFMFCPYFELKIFVFSLNTERRSFFKFHSFTKLHNFFSAKDAGEG